MFIFGSPACFALSLFLICLHQHSSRAAQNLWIKKEVFQIMKIFKLTSSYIFQNRPVAVPMQITPEANCSIIIFIQVICFTDFGIPLWWILLFVHCYISAVLPLEIPMALAAESFSCYLFQQENRLFFLYLLKITIIQIWGKRIYTKQGEGDKEETEHSE